ncbi:hypothetical protein pipiens_005956 [Culex pipiens pipiens]|uniref:FLYWCH-type domain-containing protein n=2 Tax=Culex pipiens TaxID=7175 RepID=A0ABD1DSF9_CULPP
MPGIFEPAVFGTTRRGQQKLLYGGHAYTKDRQSAKTCNWKCSLFTRYKCKARAVTREINGIVYVKATNTMHYHPAEQYKISFRRMSTLPTVDDGQQTFLSVIFKLPDEKVTFVERAKYEYTLRGTQQLVHNGFYFSKNKTLDGGTRVNWKCQFYERLRCRARAITKSVNGFDYVRVTNDEHTHTRDISLGECPPRKKSRRRIPKLEHSLDDTDEDLDVKTKFPLDLKMVVGRKGRPMLLMGGYAFFRNNSNKNKTYWLCAKSRSLKCRARIITLDGSAAPPKKKSTKAKIAKVPKTGMPANTDEILAQGGIPVVYQNSRFGAAPVVLDQQIFQFVFTKTKMSVYRCQHHKKHFCPAQVLVKAGLMYKVGDHNHQELAALHDDSSARRTNESYFFVTTSDGELQLKESVEKPKKKIRAILPAIKPSFGGSSGVSGFDFPLIDQEDIERLENTVSQSNDIRRQYINFLARKKAPSMTLVQFMPAIFSDEALDGYNYNGSNTLGKTKLPMRGYDIFSHCFIEAFGDRDGMDEVELASQMSAAIKQSRNRMRQRTPYKKRFDDSESVSGNAARLRVAGFSFPIRCEEDVERLERMVNISQVTRQQYVTYLKSKKTANEDAAVAIGKCFTDQVLSNFTYNGLNHPQHPRKAMKEYMIFTECFLDAWHHHEVTEHSIKRSITLACQKAKQHISSARYYQRYRGRLLEKRKVYKKKTQIECLPYMGEEGE